MNDCSYIKTIKGKIHMNMKLFYNITAWAYDLLDVIYFNNYERSPRKAVLDAINPDDTILDLCTGAGANAVRIGAKLPNSRLIVVDLSQ